MRTYQGKSGTAGVRATRSAFTLIELLLVLVILAVLAGIVVPRFVNRTEQAKNTAAQSDIASIDLALDAFEIDTGGYPSAQEGLKALVESNAKGWRGPYLKKGLPVDPWGNAYVYHHPGQHNANGYDLSSTGPDGIESSDDVNNWSQP